MPFITTTLEASGPIVSGLSNGSLTRWGGVIREAGTGRQVAHLKEVGSGLQQLAPSLGRIAGLTQVAAGASVLNLGVTAVGFAYMAHRMNQLQTAVEAVSHQIDEGFAQVGGRFDRVDVQLGYLTALAIHNSEMQAAIRRDLQRLTSLLVSDALAELTAEVNHRQRFMEPATPTAVKTMEVLKSRLWARAASFSPTLEPEALVTVDLCLQGCVAAAAIEADLLWQLGEADEALEVMASAERSSRQLAEHWTRGIIAAEPGPLNSVYRFATPPLQDRISPGRIERIARNSSVDRGLSREDIGLRRRNATVELDMLGHPTDPGWRAAQTGQAAYLDLLAETADRAYSHRQLALARVEGDLSPVLASIEASPDNVYVISPSS